jgi:hypothetical protein
LTHDTQGRSLSAADNKALACAGNGRWQKRRWDCVRKWHGGPPKIALHRSNRLGGALWLVRDRSPIATTESHRFLSALQERSSTGNDHGSLARIASSAIARCTSTLIAIVLQNATVRRSVQMMQALLENYGTRLLYDGQELYCAWEPKVMDRATEQELRDLKVGYRAKSIKRVTAAFAQREIDEFDLRTRSGEEQRQALLGLYGIGPASVE